MRFDTAIILAPLFSATIVESFSQLAQMLSYRP
jgi:hypothetical protein